FPALQVNNVSLRLEELTNSMMGPDSVDPSLIGTRVPRTPSEKEALLRERPRGWEYLLLGAALYIGRERLEGKWPRFARPPHRRLHEITDVAQASRFVSSEMDQLIGLTEALERVFTPEVQELAFGPPGVEGDSHRIEHLADRVTSTYEGIL